jgi:hypothetical protein
MEQLGSNTAVSFRNSQEIGHLAAAVVVVNDIGSACSQFRLHKFMD